MTDYKAMYYHLAGRMAGAIDALEASTVALQAATAAIAGLMETMKKAQRTTEEMFINSSGSNGTDD